jgi:hypothetical protein
LKGSGRGLIEVCPHIRVDGPHRLAAGASVQLRLSMRCVTVWGVVGKALDTNSLAIRMTPDGTANGLSDGNNRQDPLVPAQEGNQVVWQRYEAYS